MGDILVLAEHRQGALRDVSFEMMAVAPALAADMGGEVTVLLIGSGVDEMAKKLAAYGSKVLVIDDPLFENFNADKYQ
jgi:electron transfer flavoprotein alpha subunit